MTIPFILHRQAPLSGESLIEMLNPILNAFGFCFGGSTAFDDLPKAWNGSNKFSKNLKSELQDQSNKF